MTQHAVVIVGGGPTGMMLGAELTLAGVDALIVERRADSDLEASRSGGLHARTIEVLDQRGVAQRFLSAGTPMQVQSFSGIPLDISDFPARHNYGLALWQKDFERILAGWAEELRVPIRRRVEVTAFSQDSSGVEVELSDGTTLEAQYLVGCDGGRSIVRKNAGIDFAGWDPSISSLVAEVEMTDELPVGLIRDEKGQHGMGRLEDGRTVRVVVSEEFTGQPPTGPADLDDLKRALTAVWGTDFGVHSPKSVTRFTDMSRQAAEYRRGRVLLAGDAAHIHYPVGGQGMNTGVQDAVNLGWKLAQVVKGISSDELLDSYHAERHPVAARVLHNTMGATVIARSNPRIDALRDILADALGQDGPRRHLAGMISGLDIHYDLGGEHPLVGWRMPDLDLHTHDGPARVYEWLHAARPVLLDLGGLGDFDLTPWADRVRLVRAAYEGDWALPVVGPVPGAGAVLIRPDGHVAWAGDQGGESLRPALTRWFGSPA